MLLCLGLGYSALHYLQLARPERAYGTVRESGAVPALPGLRTTTFDLANAELKDALQAASEILVSIPPGETGDPVLQQFANVLPRGARIVYLSSLGVYGDTRGAIVDEESVCRPQFPRSQARLAAEQAWIKAAKERQATLTLLRLAGIYGPGRNALVALMRGEAKRIVKPGQVFNRVHVADIAQAIGAAFANDPGGIFNVADDEPSPPGDPVAFAAQLVGIEPPPEVPFDQARRSMTPMALSFYEECRRADNSKLKSALGVRLRYPTYREGLRALFETGEAR
jgi:nucleoside-diphosphate-sugar epimerase